MIALLALVLLQAPSSPPVEKEFQRLADLALAAPPELAADTLLRLVEANAVKSRDRRIELLRQAFEVAPGAKFPLMIAHFMPGHSTDSDVDVLESSLEGSKLDTLSLRCRAVRQMLRIDKRAALEELFAQIPPPRVPALTCRDASGYSLDEFYGLVAELANSAFTEKEARDSKPALFVEGYVRAAASPFQIKGVAAAILAARVTNDDFARLAAAFALSLKSMNADARSFSSTYSDVSRAVFEMAEACRRKGISGFALADAYRSYAVKHMSASRCGEENKAFAGIGTTFETLRKAVFPAAEGIPPIAPDELKPAKTEERAAVYECWEKGDPNYDLMDGILRLKFGITREQQEAVRARGVRSDHRLAFLTLEERQDPQWEIAFREFLNTLENRRKDFADFEANHFHMLCFTYTPLIELAPPGRLQQMALKSFVEFLKQSPMERSSPPEWLLEYSRLLAHGDGTPEGRAGIREEIKRSGDGVMNLYVELERITGKRT